MPPRQLKFPLPSWYGGILGLGLADVREAAAPLRELEVEYNAPVSASGVDATLQRAVELALASGQLELVDIRGAPGVAVQIPLDIAIAAPPRSFGMRLTSTGGAAWEAVAKPDWSRFLDFEMGDESREGERSRTYFLFFGADRARVEEFARRSLAPGMRIKSESWIQDQPFRVTNWKSLQEGWRLRIELDGGDYWEHADALQEVDEGFLKWYQY